LVERSGMEWNGSTLLSRSRVQFRKGMEWNGSTKTNIRRRCGTHSFHRFGGTSPFLSTNRSLPKKEKENNPHPVPLAHWIEQWRVGNGGGARKRPGGGGWASGGGGWELARRRREQACRHPRRRQGAEHAGTHVGGREQHAGTHVGGREQPCANFDF
jgi:hypothetical protein